MGPAARKNYARAFAVFSDWLGVVQQVLSTSGVALEVIILQYLDHLLDADVAAHKAELAVAAIKDQLPQLLQGLQMNRVRRALVVFRKLRPHRSRVPISKEVMAAIVTIFVG